MGVLMEGMTCPVDWIFLLTYVEKRSSRSNQLYLLSL